MPKDTTEARLMRRAIVERWPITPENRAAVIARLLTISSSNDPRAATTAARALIQADSVNLKQAELFLARYGADEEGGEDAVVIDADPEIARLEAELIARRAAIGQGDSRGAGVGDDIGPVEVAEPAPSDAAERGTADRGDNPE